MNTEGVNESEWELRYFKFDVSDKSQKTAAHRPRSAKKRNHETHEIHEKK